MYQRFKKRAALAVGTAAVAVTVSMTTSCAARADAAESGRHIPKPTVGMSREALRTYLHSPMARVAVGFYEALQSGRFTPFTDVLSKNWTDTPLGTGQGPGLAGWKSQIEYFHHALPDLRVHIDALYVDGRTVGVRETVTGTQDGSFLGVAPTKRHLTFRAADTHEVAGDRIVANWHLEDMLGAYQQMTAS